MSDRNESYYFYRKKFKNEMIRIFFKNFFKRS